MLTRVRWRWRGWPVQVAGLAVTWRWGTLCGWQLRYTSWNSTWYSCFLMQNIWWLIYLLITFSSMNSSQTIMQCYFSLGSLLLHLGIFRIYLLLSFFFNVKRGFHENPFRDTRTVRLLQSFIECQTSVGGKVLVSQDRKTISNPTLAALHCCHSSGTT